MLIMCVGMYKLWAPINDITNILDLIFTTIFIFEAVIKIIGLGKFYFYSGWNIFDFVIVLFSIIGMVLSINNTTTLKNSFNITLFMHI